MIGATAQREIHELNLGANRLGVEERFVVGEENRLVVALFELLFQSNDDAPPPCNPLTLVGPSGSGKSMLAQGIVRRWQTALKTQSKSPDSVAYFTTADFGRELQAFGRDEHSDIAELRAWRRKLRQVELLVVEDLQQLRQRSTIQQELCCSIEAIIDRGGRVVFTSNQEPLSLDSLRGDGAALRDRLAAGLVLRLQSPGPAARLKLLSTAAQQRGMELSEEQLTTFVSRSRGKTPVKLFGMLSEFDYSQQNGEASLSTISDEEAVSFKQIATIVCRYLGIKKTDLSSNSRRKSLTQARGIATVLARQLTPLSYAEIGRHLGGRDHSTMINAAEKIERDRAKIPALEQALGELEHLLTAV